MEETALGEKAVPHPVSPAGGARGASLPGDVVMLRQPPADAETLANASRRAADTSPASGDVNIDAAAARGRPRSNGQTEEKPKSQSTSSHTNESERSVSQSSRWELDG
ncbi:hypothetical protein EYF80_014315 [Liparis tanakae]|uniref:Uncharacterized protein n=1 Tax=Liparis tanakae TaxID=230148 RepID=A0A4Z2IEM1_9TELE|nr:hypothetical protein EYF80_014315 [Liparis tanakae]